MPVDHFCPCTEKCPLQKAMEAIGGKWKIAILCSLSANGATRYNDLKRKMKGISNTMLAKSLKELEDHGLVKRTEYMEVPVRVEYEVTPFGNDLKPIMLELAKWGNKINEPSSS